MAPRRYKNRQDKSRRIKTPTKGSNPNSTPPSIGNEPAKRPFREPYTHTGKREDFDETLNNLTTKNAIKRYMAEQQMAPATVGRKRRGSTFNAQAQQAADEAVARIPNATDYQKDMVEAFVYNMALAGQWKNIPYLQVGRLGSGGGDVDLTGNHANATFGGTGGVYTEQDGIYLPSGAWMETDVNPLDVAANVTDREFYILGHMSEYDNSGLGSNDFTWFASLRQGDLTSYGLGYNQNQLPDARMAGYFNATFEAADFDVLTESAILNKTFGLLGNNSGLTTFEASGVTDSDTVTNFGNGADGIPFYLGARNNAGTADQNTGGPTIAMFGLGSPNLDYALFESEMNQLLAALERTEAAFTNTFIEGDSLMTLDNPVLGIVPITAYIEETTTDNNTAESSDVLSAIQTRITTDLQTNGNPSGYTAVVLTGGTNDINPDNDTGLITMQSEVDTIFSVLAAAEIWDVFYCQVTPLRFSSFDPGALPQTPPPGDLPPVNIQRIKDFNAYVQTKIDAHNAASPYKLGNYAATDSGVYDEMEADDPNFTDAMSRQNPDYSLPTDAQVIMPDNTKPAYTVFGVHYTDTGAAFRGDKVDDAIRAVRYVKK